MLFTSGFRRSPYKNELTISLLPNTIDDEILIRHTEELPVCPIWCMFIWQEPYRNLRLLFLKRESS